MFGMKKVIVCLNNLSSQVQMMNVRMGTMEEKLEVLDVRMGAVEEKLEELDVRMGAMEGKISALDEKVDMVEYHLSKEIEVTYQAVLENKRNIARLSHRLDEYLNVPVRQACPVPV